MDCCLPKGRMTGKAALEGTSLNKTVYLSENDGICWKSIDSHQQLIQAKKNASKCDLFLALSS